MYINDAELLEMADDEEKNSTCSGTGYYKYIPTPIELFFKAKRPEFKRLYPNIGNRDRRKKMRLAWKNTSDEEKEPYIAERNRLKEEAYGSETTTTYGNSTIPMNIFCRVKRPEFQQLFPDLDNNCIVGKMRQVWRKMSDEERKCFMEEYGKTEAKEISNEEKVTKKTPILQVGRSKKRNEELTAGFFIFVEEHRQKNLKNFNKLRSLKIGYELRQQWGETRI
ncbi:hypothetical protein GCK72_004363 [Caenorhabditis remanei]|uniref:HMG box domain-containing protein n=1 Tax=Caenorhabditis remanei TaxID=31234 RepID=A0A6A5HB21_CAERE|nr:hypothetical protein GCK72_004363 [Caenorhabditis remanei]KAF1764415.1 hypothetical protein GCK72_004363 [Caenorhabditis remanei]